ncbi:hypothetical protein D3C75_1056810 [compost metagenome]
MPGAVVVTAGLPAVVRVRVSRPKSVSGVPPITTSVPAVSVKTREPEAPSAVSVVLPANVRAVLITVAAASASASEPSNTTAAPLTVKEPAVPAVNVLPVSTRETAGVVVVASGNLTTLLVTDADRSVKSLLIFASL